MKKGLLQLKEEDRELTVEGRNVNTYDIDLKFDEEGEGRLSVEDRGAEERERVSSYIISKELVNAVNAAIVTGRPLLLKGEPGCGKTKLAQAVAVAFFGENANRYYHEWHVKSNSNAQEGGYVFDHVNRLRDATVSDKDEQARNRVENLTSYIELGPMGRAFLTETPEERNYPAILLIDEIDKGNIDFPNDLLLELDEMRFRIGELKDYYVKADREKRPLVFITSNDERELPPAFLRRCLYYRIPPFEQDLLEKIARKKLQEFYTDLDIADKSLISEQEVTAIVKKFLEIKDGNTTGKPPSTSEMLDWLMLITYHLNQPGAKKVEELIEDKNLQTLALKIIT